MIREDGRWVWAAESRYRTDRMWQESRASLDAGS